jgi:GMC oxidoreductase
MAMDKAIGYDLIVVGSGNGACGFLSHYLSATQHLCPAPKILILEEGEDFFETSDITHQNNWTESYAEKNVFKLHNALTPAGRPIISGRACTMGGGGSINYTMIHESSDWLATHLGYPVDYWNHLKRELNAKFMRPDPAVNASPVTRHVLKVAQDFGFTINPDNTEHIPDFRVGDGGLLHQFPTQFDRFGQRTHSGVSLIDWNDSRITFKIRCKVEALEFETGEASPARCLGVHVQYLETGQLQDFKLNPNGGKLLLCAGAATPQLLRPHRHRLGNSDIGEHVNDHVLLPLGIYLLDKTIEVTGRDVYIPVFATTLWQPEPNSPGVATVCCFDFFSGTFERLWYLISHLYLAFLLPNWLKKWVIRTPWLFLILKNSIRLLIQFVNWIINVWTGVGNISRGRSWVFGADRKLITAIVKFNPAITGDYSAENSLIRLRFFDQNESTGVNQDQIIAEQEISRQLTLLNNLGQKPPWLVRFIYRLFTKIPYEQDQIRAYVDTYRRKFLLSEQHLSGGCVLGKALDRGLDCPTNTGKVFGSANVYVADLSAVPLPRISPQMTAYLLGFHVAKQLCGDIGSETRSKTDRDTDSETITGIGDETL